MSSSAASSSSLPQKFLTPEFYDFKPFFTLQPVSETREKQLKCWCSIILNYCTFSNVYTIDPTRFPLFRNASLGRQLSVEGIQTVIQKLIDSGIGNHFLLYFYESYKHFHNG